MTMNNTMATLTAATLMAWIRFGCARLTSVLSTWALLAALAAPSLALAETLAQDRPSGQAAKDNSGGGGLDQRVVKPALDPDYTDPLRTAQRLARDGGIPHAQTAATSSAIHGVVSVHVQSLKNHITDFMEGMEARLETRMEGMEARLETRIEGVEARLETKMEAKMEGIEAKMEVMGAWMGGIELRQNFLIFTVIAGLFSMLGGGYYFSRRLPSPQSATAPAPVPAASGGGFSRSRWRQKNSATGASLAASSEQSVEGGGKRGFHSS